jgi:arginine exporter protein ArgO
LIASSARIEQWIFTGGSASSSAIWVFLMASASSSVLPLTHSVTSELDAIAEPQP